MDPNNQPDPNNNVPSAIPVSSFLQTDEAQNQQPPANPQQPPAAPAHSGSFLSHILPAAGGVLGGILGGVADVGSLGLLAPVINPVTGAMLGGAAGQAGENAMEGKKVLAGNDVTSGIENGVGELAGLGVGKVVKGLGEGVAAAGEKGIQKAATDKATTDATEAALRDQKATELNFGGVSPEMQKALKLGDNQDFLDSMGMDKTDPREMAKASQAGFYMNNVYDRALANAKPVDMSDAGKLFGASEGKATTGLTAEEQAAAQKMGISPELQAKGTVQGGEGAPGTTPTNYEGIDPNSPTGQALAEFNKSIGAEPTAKLPDQMNATDVRKLQQAVGHQIQNVQKYVNGAQLSGKYDAQLIGQLQDLNTLYGKLGAKIKTPEVNDAIKNLVVTPADRQGLIEQYGDKLGSHIADTISKAQSADNLLGPMQQFKRMDDLAGMANEDITQARGTPRATKRANFAANAGVMPGSQSAQALQDVIDVASKATKSPAHVVIAAGQKLHEAGVTPKIAKGIGTAMAKTAPLIPPAATAVSNIPNVAAETVPAPGAGAPSNQQGGAMPPTAMPAYNPVNSALDSALTVMNTPGGFLTPGYSSAVGAVDALAPKVQGNEMAANAAATLTPTLNNAGGPAGTMGGTLDRILAMVPGTAQNTFQRQQQATAEQIAKILGITPQAAMAMLPQMTQTPGTAAPQENATAGLVGQLTAGLPAAQ